MTENRKKDLPAETAGTESKPALMSRRAMLKQAGAAMPAVLTLQSGAAMAASSVYIGTTTRSGSLDSNGNVHCLDVSNAEQLPNGTTYKFVDSWADVYVIPDGPYYSTKGRGSDPIFSDQFCRDGGTLFLDAPGWPQVDLPPNLNGVLVSSTAIASVQAAMDMQRIIP